VAENQDDKTEHKSRKKWEQARDRGELPRSQEFATFIVFVVIILYFHVARLGGLEALGDVMAELLDFDEHLDLDAESLGVFLLRPLLGAALALAPFFLLVLVVSTFANMGQTGFHLAKEKVGVDWSRLDPITGVRKIVSLRAWVEGLKASLKVALILWIAYDAMRDRLPEMVEMSGRPLRDQMEFMLSLSLSLAARIAILMAAFAVADYGFQWWKFQDSLRMTRREVKEEAREHEGDPLMRRRLRSLRLQMARERMMSKVPKAKVVLTNPTHYAVAVSYDRETMAAPIVCAKGKELLARRIREFAAECGVPIVENPPMARALFKKVKVGRAIPSEFHRAVAELLAFIYMLDRKGGSAAVERGETLRPKFKAALPAEGEPE
jgi:flagellar biosynthetic protein FlhB